MKITSVQAMEIFEVKKATLTRWKQAGAKVAYTGTNSWNLRKLMHWWIENIYQGPVSSEGEESSAGNKEEYWKWKTQAEKIKVEQLMGKLISKRDVIENWSARVGVVTSGLKAFSNRLPPILAGKTRNEISEIIESEVNKLREGYAKNGRYTPES